MFADRTEAGLRLAEQLVPLGPWLDTVVVGIPRGGVVVAAEVARVLNLPLDVVVTAKVSAPSSPEYAIGALSADGVVYPNAESGQSAANVSANAGPARDKVARAGEAFATDRAPLGVSGKAVLVVDDGLATGLTALAAVDYLRRSGAALVVLAAPVASRQAIEKLKPSVDRLVVVEVPPDFRSVGQFYLNFDQTQDAEVVELLSRADKLGPG